MTETTVEDKVRVWLLKVKLGIQLFWQNQILGNPVLVGLFLTVATAVLAMDWDTLTETFTTQGVGGLIFLIGGVIIRALVTPNQRVPQPVGQIEDDPELTEEDWEQIAWNTLGDLSPEEFADVYHGDFDLDAYINEFTDLVADDTEGDA